MSKFVCKNINPKAIPKSIKGKNLSQFQEIIRQKCQQRIRERRNHMFSKGRSSLLSAQNVQETLTEIVRQEFNNLATAEKSEVMLSKKDIINRSSNENEASQEENDLTTEEEQYIMIMQEYERLMSTEQQMFDMGEETVFCPMCQKSFLDEIPDFIICNLCGLKIRTEISLKTLKRNLEVYVNMHSESCLQVPDFSLMFEDEAITLYMSCTACSNIFLIKTTDT